jgi:hypothetical protein
MLNLKSKTPSSIAQLTFKVASEWGFSVLLLTTAICVFVPFSPSMPPGERLDPSSWMLDPPWVFGLNQAIAQGLTFGRDIIFTFGPYVSIYTKQYHPATDGLMVWGSLYLGLAFGLAAFLNFKNNKWYLQLLLLITLAGIMYLRDPLLFYYPLLVGAYVFRSVTSSPKVGVNTIRRHLLLIALFSPFGLLPLIKGSVIVICVAIVALSCSLIALKQDWKGAVLVCISPLISVVIFWVVAGQPLSGLPSYFISMLPIISGYTEAMSSPGNTKEIFYYIIAAAILLWLVFQEADAKMIEKVILLLMFSVVLFMAFKGGFVRHDGHAIISGTMILLTALLVSSIHGINRTLIALFVAFFVWHYIDSGYIKTNSQSFLSNIASTYRQSWNGLVLRIEDKGRLTHDFKETTAQLQASPGFPILLGTTDVYASELILVNSWNPRPVLQSFSVYTPTLVEKNKEHLVDNGAPDNLIFKVQSIDGRIPSLEDGASWPVILSNYGPTWIKDDFLFLRKNPTRLKLSEAVVSNEKHSFGEVVSLPGVHAPIFAKIDIKQSVLGKLANTFFKPSQLEVTINMEAGSTRNYRIISGMAKTGFLLSPLIENTNEFGLLSAGAGYLEDKKVRSFSINAKGGNRLWNAEYEIEFVALDLPAHQEATKLASQFEQPELQESNSKILSAEKCDGSIDYVNGASPAPSSFKATTSLLYVNGWLARSVDKGLLPERVYVVLSGQSGRQFFMKTKQTPRPDVGAYFKKSQLDMSGFAATADISELRGRYSLGLAYEENGAFKLCPQFNITAEFNVK